MAVVCFHVDKFLKPRLETCRLLDMPSKRSQPNVNPTFLGVGLQRELCSFSFLTRMQGCPEVVMAGRQCCPHAHHHGQHCSELHSLTSSQSRNLINQHLELPALAACQGWGLVCFRHSTAGVIFMRFTFDCAGKRSLLHLQVQSISLTSGASWLLLDLCPQEGPLGITVHSSHVGNNHQEVSSSLYLPFQRSQICGISRSERVCAKRGPHHVGFWRLALLFILILSHVIQKSKCGA